jgi:tetratricopeptide (TPR) repeat protein
LLTATLGALLPLGRVDEILKYLERAGVIARQLGDTRREAVVLLQLAVMLWTSGKYLQGLQAAGEASAAAASAGSRSLQMAAAQARMMLNHGLGRYAKVLEDALEVERQFAAELSERRIMAGWAVLASLNVKVFLADVLARRGEFEAAQEACDAGYRELEGHEHVFSRVLLDCVQGAIWTEQGQYGQAVSRLQAALQACQANDVPTMHPPILAALAMAMALDGQAVAAAAQLRQAIDNRLYLAGGRYNEFYFARVLAVALAQAGRYDEALAAAADARDKAALYGQGGHEVEALYTMADIEMKAGRHEPALAHFQLVEKLAQQCSMTYLQKKAGQCRARISAALATTAGVPH